MTSASQSGRSWFVALLAVALVGVVVLAQVMAFTVGMAFQSRLVEHDDTSGLNELLGVESGEREVLVTETIEGPDGNVTVHDCHDGYCDVTVNVTAWNQIHVLHLYGIRDGQVTRSVWLHPQREAVTLTGVDNETYVTLVVPMRDDEGIGWEWSFDLYLPLQYEQAGTDADGGAVTHRFNGHVVNVIHAGTVPAKQDTARAMMDLGNESDPALAGGQP